MKLGGLRSFIGELCIGRPTGSLSSATLVDALAHKHSYKVVGHSPKQWIAFVHEQDGGDDCHGLRPQNGVELLKQERDVLSKDAYSAWGDVSGADLDPVKVAEAREEGMSYFRDIGACTRVPRSHQQQRGGTIISVKAIDVHKGDRKQKHCRSRWVGREFNLKKDDALYAATPLL